MIPKHSVSVWQEGNSLVVYASGLGETGQGHNMYYPLTREGILLLLNLLRERQRSVGKLTSKSAPTNHQIAAALSRRKPKGRKFSGAYTHGQLMDAKAILQRMGMLK